MVNVQARIVARRLDAEENIHLLEMYNINVNMKKNILFCGENSVSNLAGTNNCIDFWMVTIRVGRRCFLLWGGSVCFSA